FVEESIDHLIKREWRTRKVVPKPSSPSVKVQRRARGIPGRCGSTCTTAARYLAIQASSSLLGYKKVWIVVCKRRKSSLPIPVNRNGCWQWVRGLSISAAPSTGPVG